MIYIKIKGPPVPWERARLSKHKTKTGRPIFFDAQAATRKTWRKQVAPWLKGHGLFPTKDLFRVRFVFAYETPQSKKAWVKPGDPFHWTGRYDTDNLVKFAFDALQGFVVVNDSQFWQHAAKRIYDVNSYTLILLRRENGA